MNISWPPESAVPAIIKSESGIVIPDTSVNYDSVMLSTGVKPDIDDIVLGL